MKILRPEEVQSLPSLRELTPAEQAEALKLARAAFTAEDLQKFTEVEKRVPMEEVLKELEETQAKFE